ncbi:acyltransferase [Thiotrichales bacterium 19S11-10]|nr:acyltransferase [Thiotrichales bacterium 19S11-10]
MIKFIPKIFMVFSKVINRLFMFCNKNLFLKAGKNVKFHPFDEFSYETISIGNDVFIGKGAVWMAPDSSITVGDKVMFGPKVTIMGGDHNTSVIGSYMCDVKLKRPDNDLPVIIEDDVWIGCNVTTLKGVTIGAGSVVAAGSVVTKSISPYSIYGGVPAKFIKKRFNEEQVELHQTKLKNIRHGLL